jgi:hypothetical protein
LTELFLSTDSIAVLVVHADEPRLSINERNTSFGYGQLFQALLKNTSLWKRGERKEGRRRIRGKEKRKGGREEEGRRKGGREEEGRRRGGRGEEGGGREEGRKGGREEGGGRG